jgi:hypothetical protein
MTQTAAPLTHSRPDTRFRAPRAIFWVGFLLRVAVILIGHTYKLRSEYEHFNFGFEAGRIARSLVLGQGYANPFNGPSGPTAWLPPIYPLLLAGCFKVFGLYTRAAAFAILTIDSFFSALIAPAVYELAARTFDARGLVRRGSQYAEPVALWSAWLWAAYPAALQYAIHWIWEMSVSTCLFTWALVYATRLRGLGEGSEGTSDDAASAERQPLTRWAVFGLLWGLLALSNPSLLICFAPVVLWVGWPRVKRWSVPARTWVGVLAMSLVFLAVMTPWVVRNERVMHAFIPTRSNLGIELYESTLPSTEGLSWGPSVPMSTRDPEFKLFARMGEVPYAAMRNAQAKQRIAQNPRQFWHWAIDRFFFFWDGTPHPPEQKPVQELLRQINYGSLSLCGLLGLALMLRRRIEGVGLFAIVFALVPIPYYFVTVQARFRHPMEPLIAILGVYLFRATEPRRPRVAV